MAKGYVFCVNMHPFEQRWVAELQARYPGIRFIKPLTDIYPILKHASVLLTDYSSLAFDFLLLDRPVVFYRPDHEEYVAKSRALIAGAEDYVCGEMTTATAALIAAADKAVAAAKDPSHDPTRNLRHSLRKRLYDHIDGDSGRRLARVIADALEKD